MSAGDRVFVMLSIAVLLCGLAGPVAATPPVDACGCAEEPNPAQQDVTSTTGALAGANATQIVIQIDVEGNAHWRITESFNLSTTDQRTAFETLRQEFESGQTPQLGLPAFQSTVDTLDQSTSREMALTDVERTSDTRGSGDDAVGVLELSFTWEQFASVDGERILINDSVLIAEDGGLWLGGLSSNQRLVIQPPEGYGVDDANVAPRNGELQWEGPIDFDEESLEVTFIGNRNNGTDGPQIGSDGLGFLPIVLGGIIILLGAVLLAARRDTLQARLEHLGPVEEESEDESTTDDGDEQPDEPAATPAPVTEDEADETDLELLSDEERVERLLEDNGGRMKQASIVSETGWSNAKVSQLLSSMEDDDRIDKLRIGRENLISFPEEEVSEIQPDEE
jgi:uncharacterized membrane protein